jgi:molecular chaperone GrpE
MSETDAKDPTPTPVQTSDQPVETPGLSSEEEIAVLRQQLCEKDAEVSRERDRFLRERAELENFKKRMQREKADALRFACEPLIRGLLPVIDNLERALAHEEGDGKPIREGVRMVLDALLALLEGQGVQRIDALGQRFDPAKHQALAQVDSAQHDPNHVVEQLHSGYLLHDRLLRPALVTVNARKAKDSQEIQGAVESEDASG